MKGKFPVRAIYGIGLACIAVGFAMPLLDLWITKPNGFEIFELLDAFKSGIEIAGYVLFGCACVGAVCAFVPKLKTVDLVSFIGIVGSLVYVLIRLGVKVGGKSSGKTPSFITDFAFDMLEPGAFVLIIGLILAIIGFVMSLGKKR